MRAFVLGPIVFLGGTLCAQQPAWADPPKLVVGIVVDQMRADYVYRYWDNFGEGGFKRLVNEGAFCRNAHFPYVPTDTGPGHASLYTGTTPSRHGIVANDFFVRSLGRTVYCAEDTAVRIVGVDSGGTGRSPVQLLATTLADELERATQGRSRTIGISLKDRGAILPIGRTGDAAYWFQTGADGRFVSSTWYMNDLPSWVKAFNAQHPVKDLLAEPWELLLPAERYHSPLPDDNPYEYPLPGATTATLPADLPGLFAATGNTELLWNSPAGNTLLTDLALAALEAEDLGADAVTDLLAISYSSTDKLGHRMGPMALELEDMYLRLDRELARLLEALDQRVGREGYVLFLTADHGAPDVPAQAKELGASAGYLDLNALRAVVEEHLQQAFGAGPWVRYLDDDRLYLDHTTVKARNADLHRVQRAAAEAARTVDGLYEAYTAKDLEHGGSGLMELAGRGHHPLRGGDLHLVTLPGWLPAHLSTGRGTDHGSGWNPDTHVPLFFLGSGIVPGEVLERVQVTGIVPTLSLLLGQAFPDAADGPVIDGVLVR